MSVSGVSFEKRLRNIVRDHQRLNTGAVHAIRSDGLIVARPRVYNPKFPLRGLLLLVASAVLFKAYIFASLGASVYNDRVAQLSEGTFIEKAGAWVMQADAVTVGVAQALNALGF